jgi:hypothetical protein
MQPQWCDEHLQLDLRDLVWVYQAYYNPITLTHSVMFYFRLSLF